MKPRGNGNGTKWKGVTVGAIMEVLPKADQKLVEAVFKGKGDMDEDIAALMQIFDRNRKALAAIRFDANFLAYATAYAAYRLKKKGQ